MKNILIIDACITPSYLGIYSQERRQVLKAKMPQNNAMNEVLFEELDKLLKQANLAKNDLGGIVCIKGPGSFTGIRIGLAFAKGLRDGLKIPAIGLTSFDKYKQDGAVILPCDEASYYVKILDKIYDKPVAKDDIENLTEGLKIYHEKDEVEADFLKKIDESFDGINNDWIPASAGMTADLTPLYIKGHYAEK